MPSLPLPFLFQSLASSLLISGLAAFLATFLGWLIAVGLWRTGSRISPMVASFLAIPMVWPPFYTAIGWMVLFGESGLTLFQREAFSSPFLNFLFSPYGAAWVQALSFWPIAAVFTFVSLNQMDRSLLDLVLLEGGGQFRKLGLVLRLTAPACLLSGILVALSSLNDVGAAELLQVHTLPVLLYSELNLIRSVTGILPYSAPLLIFLGLLLVVWMVARPRLTVESVDLFSTGGFQRRSSRVGVFSGIVVLIGVGPGVSFLTQASSLWKHFGELPFGLLIDVAVQSVMTALGAVGIVGAVLGLLLSFRLNRWFEGALDLASFTLFACPAPLLGLLGIRAMTVLPQSMSGLLDTFWILSIACALRAFWPAWTIIRLGRDRIHPTLLDQAEMDGVRWGSRSYRVMIPLLAYFGPLALYSVWVLSLSEVTLCRILQPPGIQTLSVRTVNFMHWGHDGLIAASLILLSVLLLAPLLLPALRRWFH